MEQIFQITGLLHGRVLRSPHAHARIVSIDTSRAETHPGVKGVVTAQDLPTAEDKMADLGEGTVNLKYLCDNILASDKVLYKGHAIAAVAATNPHIAEEACQLIDVKYEGPTTSIRGAPSDGTGCTTSARKLENVLTR